MWVLVSQHLADPLQDLAERLRGFFIPALVNQSVRSVIRPHVPEAAFSAMEENRRVNSPRGSSGRCLAIDVSVRITTNPAGCALLLTSAAAVSNTAALHAVPRVFLDA